MACALGKDYKGACNGLKYSPTLMAKRVYFTSYERSKEDLTRRYSARKFKIHSPSAEKGPSTRE